VLDVYKKAVNQSINFEIILILRWNMPNSKLWTNLKAQGTKVEKKYFRRFLRLPAPQAPRRGKGLGIWMFLNSSLGWWWLYMNNSMEIGPALSSVWASGSRGFISLKKRYITMGHFACIDLEFSSTLACLCPTKQDKVKFACLFRCDILKNQVCFKE